MGSKKYSKELEIFVDEYKEKFENAELAKLINEKFGYEFTANSLKSYMGNHGIHRTSRKRLKQIYSDTFPKEIVLFIKENYKGVGPTEMVNILNEKFKKTYTRQQIKNYYRNHNLNSGLTGYFEKAKEPQNKGKKMSPEVYEKVKKTMFKKGNRPHNTNKVGDITPTTDGYYKIKIAEPNEWEFCHIRNWQQANGDIPKGMVVSFKDGNKANYNLENLMLITNEENLEMNRSRLRFEEPEITETGLVIAKLKVRARKVRKNGGISHEYN